jgi:hypothetical protein
VLLALILYSFESSINSFIADVPKFGTKKSAVMDEKDYVLLVQEEKVRPNQLGT